MSEFEKYAIIIRLLEVALDAAREADDTYYAKMVSDVARCAAVGLTNLEEDGE